MGYASTVESISAEHAERLRAQTSSRTQFGGPDTFAMKVTRAAVSLWSDREYGHGDPRAYEAEMYPPVADGVGLPYDDDLSVETGHVFPVAAPASVATKTRKIKVNVPGQLADRLRRDAWGAMHELRQILITQLPVNTLGAFEVVAVPAARKPQAKVAEGKTATRYVLKPVERVSIGDPKVHAVVTTMFESQAAARAAALDLLGEHDDLPAFTVEGVVGRVTDEGKFSPTLLTVSRPVLPEVAITVQVTTHEVKPNPAIERYDVLFWYHH